MHGGDLSSQRPPSSAEADPRPSAEDLEAIASRVAALEAELAEARQLMERARREDALTGCLSRVALSEALTGLKGRPGVPVALVIDCDDFEQVNQQLGHATGDIVLRAVAARIRDALRPGDALGRVAGDDFLALAVCDSTSDARFLAERVRAAVAGEPFVWDQRPISVTVSIGLVRILPGMASVEELLSIGRLAVLKCKARGKNRVALPEDTSTAAAWLTPTLRTFLELVRTEQGLSVRAQPVVRLEDGRAVGWELLVRGPPGELENPGDLFRLAEEHHLSTTLDMTCLRRVAQAGHDLRKPGDIHVNLLPVTLLEVPAAEIVAALGPPPPRARWCVEVSERQFVGEPQELLEALAALREAGIGVAIDDLGSGRGTLDSVITLEPEVMKLDLRLVRGISTDARRQRVLHRLIRMAQALETAVVAEGIEVREDLRTLRELGVSLGQGFLWGRPQLVPRRE